jgi:peptide/nickel transport system permease protein
MAPDKSENANQMHLSIHSKPPGFRVMLSIPLDGKPKKSLSNYFIGFPNTVTEVAIESYKVIGSTIEYVEYSDEPSLKITKQLDLDFRKTIYCIS